MTGLPEMTGGPHRYRAPDFDTLADSPIVLGNPAVYEFTVDDKKHYLVNEGEGGVFDGARAAKDLEAIVREHRRMWGSLPYDKYLFLNLLTEAGGGLEHKNSTVLMGSRWLTRTRRAYVSWLELASHEFFHVVEREAAAPGGAGAVRLRERGPHQEPVDRRRRHRLLRRPGGAPRRAGHARRVPGLAVGQDRGAADDARARRCSRSSWRRSTPGSSTTGPTRTRSNTSISYYTKGAVVAFLLDARIRKADQRGAQPRRRDARRLRAVRRHQGLHRRRVPRWSPSRWPAPASRASGTRRSPARRSWTTPRRSTCSACASAPWRRPADRRAARGWASSTRNDAGRLVVTQVRRDTPGADAGLNVDDEILAIGDFRVRADRLDNRLEQYRPGDRVTLLVARREQLLRLDLTFGTEPARAWRLEVHPVGAGGPAEHPAEVAVGRQGVSQPPPPTARCAATAACCWCGCWCSRACTCSRNISAEATPRPTMLFGRAVIIILLIVVVFWIVGGMLRDARSRRRR